MSVSVEIISVGNELLTGQTVNTNASWIGEQLIQYGIQARWVTTVGDVADHLFHALQIALGRTQVCIVTGGLGPTHDDITKNVVSDFFGAKLALNDDILTKIKQRFEKRGISMAKVNEGQALVPEGATVLENDLGTAPGLLIQKNGKHIYVLPGVPHEMKAMMSRFVLPELQKKYDTGTFRIKNIKTTGIAESTLFEKISQRAAIQQLTTIAFLPGLGGVNIRLSAYGQNSDDAQEKLERAVALLRPDIEEFIYSDEKKSLENVVADMLTEKKLTLAVAESCTGGLLCHKLTNIPGSSDFFERGIISYSNESKQNLLGVPKELLIEHGAVSEQVARVMAKGVREIAGTDFGLATTGIAGPGGGTEKKPVGLVFVGYADDREDFAIKYNFANDRIGNKERFAQAALDLLRKKLRDR
ncbi:competence/damage-inducible protein A [candidate division KSB1 bacterium]|nr:competence/damage-inducible protein A [candidate division KSB1 bacterium]